jgi:hypothetical protein
MANSNAVVVGKKFRVSCLRANGTVTLVRLCATLSEAERWARAAADYHLAKLRADRATIVAQANRPRFISVEMWNEELGWESVDVACGGFSFEFLDRAPRVSIAKKKSPKVTVPMPTNELRSGVVVDCELLAQRTRKGGWFARIVNKSISGPITNWSEMPTDLQAGDTVKLRVCGIRPETGFVQLRYESPSR